LGEVQSGMSFGKDNRGPSIAELQRYVRDSVKVEFVLSNGDQVVGKLRWFDESAFSLILDGEQPFTILRSAVVGYRPHGQNNHGSTSSPKAAKASETTKLAESPAAELEAMMKDTEPPPVENPKEDGNEA
jgi:hypothetical protein